MFKQYAKVARLSDDDNASENDEKNMDCTDDNVNMEQIINAKPGSKVNALIVNNKTCLLYFCKHLLTQKLPVVK